MNIESSYLKLLKDILDNGVEKEDRTGTGTISVFGRQIRHDMKLGFPLLTTKKMAWKTMVTELVWFLRGDTNIKFLVDNGCHIWDGDAYKNYCTAYKDGHEFYEDEQVKRSFTQEEFINQIKTDDEFAKKWGELGPIYGNQWRHWGEYEIDQITNLISDLKSNPDSRRLMVTAWNPDDLPNMVLPPCHHGFQVYTRKTTREEKIVNPGKYRAISLMWNQRSCDVPLGIPFNIASYALLLEIIAAATNMVPDQLIGNLGDCHIYLNQVDGVKEQLTRQMFPLPTVNINTEFWPTETGEAGLGEIDAVGVFDGFSDNAYCKCFFEDLQLLNYESHPAIKFPLSN
jgi:thymidylate synthase